MAHRAAAFLPLVCALFLPAPTSADGPAVYSFTPGTVFLTTNWRPDEQGIWRFDSIVLKPDGCLVREFAFKDAGPQTMDAACHFIPGGFPALDKAGVFAIMVDFADRSQQIVFRTTPTSIGPTPHDNPDLSGILLGGYHSMTSPPPAVDVQRTDQWSSAATSTAHQAFHLVTHGLDCEFEIVGEGSAPCVLSSWSERDMSVLVSGSFFHQPDPLLHVEASLTAQGWVMAPVAYRPYSPLNLAILHDDLQAVNALLAQKGNPGISDTDLGDSLRTALAGHVDIAKTLVDHGAPLNSATQYQVPVLNLAASLGASGKVSDRAKAMDLVQDMVAHGASVTQGGSSSLFYAIGANDPAMVEFLLDHGADANAQTYRGSTQISAYEDAMGNAAILDVLLRHGAKPQVATTMQPPTGAAPQGYEHAQSANGAVAVGAPTSPSRRGSMQYEYGSGPSQPTAPQGSVLLYGGQRDKDGLRSGQALVIDASHCRYHVTRFDSGGASRSDYACKLMPGSQPIVPGRPGLFMLTLQLPEGPVALRGMSRDGMWFDMQSASQPPASLQPAPRLALVKAPLPAMQLDSDLQPGTHFAIDGFDCKISVAGQGTSPCLLTGWGPLGPGGASQTSVLVSGEFLRQPDRDVFITITQGGSGWVLSPAHLYPYTPAMIAAYRGDLHSLDELIAKGADLSSHDPHLDAPLAMAIARDHADIAAALIAHGAKLNELNLAGYTALSSVIGHEWHDPAEALGLITQLLDQGADPSLPDRNGVTPLIAAIEGEHKDVMQLLVAKGADVNAVTKGGDTPLSAAIMGGRVDPATRRDFVQLLIDHGANVNPRPGYGAPPLGLAISAGDLDVARLLIAHGADVNAVGLDGGTPLTAAIKGGQIDPATRRDFVQLLIDHGADVNHAGDQGITPLMIAVINQHPDIAKLLVAKGADPHAKANLNGHVVDVAGLSAMLAPFLQYQAQKSVEAQANRPLANQGIPMGALLRFQPSTSGGMTLVGQPGAAGSGETVTVTDVNGGKSASVTARQDGGYTVALAGTAHDLFMVQMSNAQKVADAVKEAADAKAHGEPTVEIPREQQGPPVYLHGDDPALTLTASVASAAPYTDSVTVTGTYTGPPNVGIRVGGSAAWLSDGKFVANDVRLQQGDNTLPIKLTTQGGLVLEQTLKVNGNGHSSIVIGVNPYAGGVAPLKVDFFCRSAVAGELLKSLRFSYLGDGKDDVTMTDGEALNPAAGRAMTHPLEYIYAKPGIYHAKATAVTGSGATVSMQMFVVVQDAAKLDAMLKALWADYLTAFGNRDKAALMQLLDDDARRTLGPAFDQQKDHAMEILKGYSPLYGGAFTGGKAVYILQRDGQTTVVYFVRDPEGLWRVDSIGG